MSVVTVSVVYHAEQGQWWASSTSPRLDGFVAVADSLSDARELVLDGLPFYLDNEPFDLRESYENGQPVATAQWGVPSAPRSSWTFSSGNRGSGSLVPSPELTLVPVGC